MKFWVGIGQRATQYHNVIEAEAMVEAVTVFADNWFDPTEFLPPSDHTVTFYAREIGSLEWTSFEGRLVQTRTLTLSPPNKFVVAGQLGSGVLVP